MILTHTHTWVSPSFFLTFDLFYFFFIFFIFVCFFCLFVCCCITSIWKLKIVFFFTNFGNSFVLLHRFGQIRFFLIFLFKFIFFLLLMGDRVCFESTI